MGVAPDILRRETIHCTSMHKHISLLLAVGWFSCLSFALPVVDNPYLNIKINREDNGVKSGFDSEVSKAVQNLVVSGPPAPEIDLRRGDLLPEGLPTHTSFP